MNNKNIIFNKTLEQYNKKYRNRRYRLLKFTKKDIENFDKKYPTETKEYLLKNRKWWLIGDTYYEIPKAPKYTWFRNINPAARVCTYALVLGALGGAGYGIYSYVNKNNVVPYKDIIVKVDEMNDILAEHKDKFSYPKLAVDYLKDQKHIQIDTLKTGDEDVEYGYNLANNEIVLIGTKDEKLKYSKSKTNKTSDVWRFKDTYTLSTKSNDETYGTYLRKSDKLKFNVNVSDSNLTTSYSSNKDETIYFNSNIDVGENTKYKLVFDKPVDTTDIPTVVTNHNDLEVNGCLGNISHYGHATSITVAELDGTYYEYGTVDGDIIINGTNKVNIEIKDEANVNSILVNNTSTETHIVVNDNSTVGTIIATEESKLKPSEIVEASKEKKKEIEIVDDPVDPEELKDFSGGFGTEKSPFTIDLKSQLLNLSNIIATREGYDSKCYKITADIDLEDEAFTPIGSDTKSFKGKFDGGNNTISNLNISQSTAYCGLFGFTEGAVNDSFKNKTDVWKNGSFYEDNITEDKYTCVIKNLTISNATIEMDNKDKKYTGSFVGFAKATRLDNLHFNEGAVTGGKGTGGIAGNITDSVLMNSSTGQNVTVCSANYHAGGLIGYIQADTASRGTAVVNCTNNAKAYTLGLGGGIGGIVGWVSIGVGSEDKGISIIGCTNNGEVTTNPNDLTQSAQYIAGIVGHANGGLELIANTTNNGLVINRTTSTVSNRYMAGMTCYGRLELSNCTNKGNIEGKSTYKAGIIAGLNGNNNSFDFILNNCTNSGNLTDEGGQIGQLTSWVQGKAEAPIMISNMTFSNDTELSNAFQFSDGGAIVDFTNVNITDNTGTYIVPSNVTSITFKSNNKLFSFVQPSTNFTGLSLDMPLGNEFILPDAPNCVVTINSKNTNVIVPENTTIKSLTITGEGSTVTNNGTITDGVNLNGSSIKLENNGLIGGFGIGGFDGTVTKEFVNNGTLSTSQKHCMSISGGTGTCNLTIHNYGTIKCTSTDSTQYLILYYSAGHFDMYNYGDSVVECDGQISGGHPGGYGGTGVFYHQTKDLGGKQPAAFISQRFENNWNNLAWAGVFTVQEF